MLDRSPCLAVCMNVFDRFMIVSELFWSLKGHVNGAGTMNGQVSRTTKNIHGLHDQRSDTIEKSRSRYDHVQTSKTKEWPDFPQHILNWDCQTNVHKNEWNTCIFLTYFYWHLAKFKIIENYGCCRVRNKNKKAFDLCRVGWSLLKKSDIFISFLFYLC